jgi:hypothetical protein
VISHPSEELEPGAKFGDLVRITGPHGSDELGENRDRRIDA